MIPTWFSPWMAWAAALAAVATFAGSQTVSLADSRTETAQEVAAHEKTRRDFEAEKTTAAVAAVDAYKATQSEERRRISVIEKEVESAKNEAETNRASAVAAMRASDSLRKQHATAIVTYRGLLASARESAASDGGQAAAEAAGVLANVQRRIDDFAGAVSGFADNAYTAAGTCARIYDATRKKPSDAAK